MSDVTRLLDAAAAGDRQAAADLLPLVYDELRKLAAARMAAESPDHTLQPTALVHEAYLRLVGRADGNRWDSRGHFFAAAAEAMRRILVEAARRKKRARSTAATAPAATSTPIMPAPRTRTPRLLALDEALDRLAADGAARGPDVVEAPLLRRPDRRGGRAAALGIIAANGRQRLGLRPGLARRRPPRRGLNRPSKRIRRFRCVIRPPLSHWRVRHLPGRGAMPIDANDQTSSWPHARWPTRRPGPPTWTGPAAAMPSCGPGSRRCSAPTTSRTASSTTRPCPPRPGHGPTQALSAPDAGHESSEPADDEVPLGFLAPPTRPDSLGRIGHYEVLQVLGQGGFGIVFRAFDDVLQRVVAVKVLAPQMAATSPARKRFLREARSSAQVRHENVVQVYEVGEQPLPYLVMEFIPGETLQQRLDRDRPARRRPRCVRIGRQIAEGLAAAHATRPDPPRHQAGQRAARRRAAAGEDHRLRPGPRRRRRQHLAERHHRRHADVHGPGAGQGGERSTSGPTCSASAACCTRWRPAGRRSGRTARSPC